MDPTTAAQNLQSIQNWSPGVAVAAIVGLAGFLALLWVAHKVFWLVAAVVVEAMSGIVFATILPDSWIDKLTKDAPAFLGASGTFIAIAAITVMALSFRTRNEDSVVSKLGTKILAGLIGGPTLLGSWAFSVSVTHDLPNLGLNFLRFFLSIARGLVPNIPDIPAPV